MKEILCPVCRGGESLPFDEQEWRVDGVSYRLLSCTSCGSIFTFPPPSDSTLENIYRTSFDYRWYQDHYEAKLRDCRIRIQEYGPRLGKRVLDFGGGVGYFSKAASEAGLESITYDPYVNASCSVEKYWDCVVALHVLEHSNNLDRTITQIKSFLTPGGRVIIAVPNGAGLGYQKLGMRWVWAQPPLVHVFHFTASGLKALLARHGFGNLEESYHERWDANLYCDLEQGEQFRKRDADWGRRPFKAFQPYRRWIARRNTQRRFEGLEKALVDYDPHNEAYSELQIIGTLKES
jgi:SAM-dependent methyltransferase